MRSGWKQMVRVVAGCVTGLLTMIDDAHGANDAGDADSCGLR